MTALFKDRYKLGLITATLFLIGILVSFYQLYRLPYRLTLSSASHPAMFNIYIILGVTFLIGAYTIWSALTYRNEVIVFRDKQLQQDTLERDSAESSKSSISLDTVKENIRQAKTEKDILQAGLHAVCKQLDAGQGALYLMKEENGIRKVELKNGYALSIGESTVISYELGEGLIGQAAAGARTLYVDDVPEGYVKIISGLGSASPRYLLITAMKAQDRILGVMEIASFTAISEDQRKFVEESAQLIADKIASK